MTIDLYPERRAVQMLTLAVPQRPTAVDNPKPVILLVTVLLSHRKLLRWVLLTRRYCELPVRSEEALRFWKVEVFLPLMNRDGRSRLVHGVYQPFVLLFLALFNARRIVVLAHSFAHLCVLQTALERNRGGGPTVGL